MLLSAASKHLNIGQKDERQKSMRHKPPVPLRLFLPHPEKPFNIRYFYPKPTCKRNIVMSCFSKVEMSCLCVNLQFCKLSANKDSYEGNHYYEQPRITSCRNKQK